MPARLRDIRRVLSTFNVDVTEPGRGSHWQLRRQGMRMFPIPAHNGLRTEIDDRYIAALCKHFGIDEAALRAKL